MIFLHVPRFFQFENKLKDIAELSVPHPSERAPAGG
jgi:hypothetical protein